MRCGMFACSVFGCDEGEGGGGGKKAGFKTEAKQRIQPGSHSFLASTREAPLA